MAKDPSDAPRVGPPSPAGAVERAWHTVAESLGTTATAALMRRAAKRATVQTPSLTNFRVEGAGYTYRFTSPAVWESAEPSAAEEVRALLGELCALLSDLTGDVVTSRLVSDPAVNPFLPPDASRTNRHASCL